MATTARGIRNNNPGNIRKNGTQWLGEVPGNDKSFKTFESMAGGIRAIYHLLNNYSRLYGCNTIEKIINRWAPPEEDNNDTESYIRTVSDLSGVPRTSRLTTTNRSVMEPIVKAMIKVETGTVVSESDYKQAWDLFIRHQAK